MATLTRGDGPAAFGVVSPQLYRGGAPSEEDLELLMTAGVTKVVDLRREALGRRRAESSAARELGLRYVERPFFGRFGTEPQFLDELLAELHNDDGGVTYVHCDDGRDRTSLVVALWRVAEDGWEPQRAWDEEVLAYGHRPSPMYREIELTFGDWVHDHTRRTETASASSDRARLAMQPSIDAHSLEAAR